MKDKSRNVLCGADEFIGDGSKDGLHHGQVLQVVVRLKKRLSCQEFHKDTSNRPDIAWV